MKMHVTIHDIANACHVSTATVSRALNNKPGVSAEIRELVIKSAKELDYIPDSTARSMRSRHRDCVYFVIRSGNDDEPFFKLPSHEAIESRLGVEVRIHTVSIQEDLIEDLSRIEGMHAPLLFIFIGPCLAEASGFSELSAPLLFIATDDAPAGYFQIMSDDALGGEGVTDSLINAGHQRIDVVTDSADGTRINYRDRITGYRKSLDKHGIKFDPSIVHAITIDYSDYLASSEQEVRSRILPMLQYSAHTEQSPTAIFVLSDFLALTVMKVLWNAGIQVPRDISMAGFGGWTLTKYTPITIHTWVQPVPDILEATMIAISCILQSKPFPKTLALPTKHPDGSYGTAVAVTPTKYVIPGYIRTGQSMAPLKAIDKPR